MRNRAKNNDIEKKEKQMLDKVNIIASNTVKVITKMFSGLIYVIGCFVVCVIAIIALFPDDDYRGGCADDGGVWDEEYRVCRFDCEHWNKKDGCILRTDDELTNFVNGYCTGKEGSGLHRCHMARLELSKRQLRDEMNKKNSGIEQ